VAPAAAAEGAADRTGAAAGGAAPAAAAGAAAGRMEAAGSAMPTTAAAAPPHPRPPPDRPAPPPARGLCRARGRPRAARRLERPRLPPRRKGLRIARGRPRAARRRPPRMERPLAAWRQRAVRHRPLPPPHLWQPPDPGRPAPPPAQGLRGLTFRRGAQDACQCVQGLGGVHALWLPDANAPSAGL